MSTSSSADNPARPIPPVARWLSIDELRLVARRDSEKHSLHFCEDLLSSGRLNHARTHAARLSGNQCTIDPTRIAIGGYSILFHLLFEGNNKCWLLRIRLPRPGESLTPQQQTAESLVLESEIATMCYVKINSTIPVPAVYGYDTSFTNPLGHPYMFIELIPGTTAMWATMSCSIDQRYRLIRGMARIINELGTMTFPAIGQLRFRNASSDSEQVSVGELVTRSGHVIGPFEMSTDYYCSRMSLLMDQKKRENDTISTAITTAGDSRDYGPESAVDIIMTAVTVAEILRNRSNSEGSAAGPFILKHPDLSFQNILVNENFDVVAVLDWSFASVVTPEEFAYFHAPTSSRLPFIFQKDSEEVSQDRQYFLTCLDEERMLHGTRLDVSSLLESEYAEMASYLAAVELKRPQEGFSPKLAQLVDVYLSLWIKIVTFYFSHFRTRADPKILSGNVGMPETS